ncbi:MAG: hypothetical protein IJR45_01820 [Firmicutes bacterium]|nr:hypothetical protein [Bacillota bacterium]MBQ9604132.1 hypothetical protein [Bacillota bacterium]
MNNGLLESLCRHIGETVTIFTASGGMSGSGFTGVLAAVDGCSVKLICSFGAAPTCPLGSACNNFGSRGNRGNYSCGNVLGSVTVIPIDKIVSFTHNAL